MSKLLTDFIKEYKSNPFDQNSYYNTINTESNTQRRSKSNKPYQSIDKTYLSYTYYPTITRNNENMNLITPRIHSSLSLNKSQRLKKGINGLKKLFGDKNTFVANLSNINKPNEFYANTIKYDEETNKKDKLNHNKPIITFRENNGNNKYDYILKNSFLKNSIIKPGIFKATKSLKDKKFFNEKLRVYKNFDSNNDPHQVSINKLNQKGREDFLNFMTEMNNIKQRKLNQWKEDILEDYNKY
jgi:hypothetical protein